ncbi:MAG: sucrase ferredoxin [Anaerolineae bacterium]|nr:sucrase ferredoxin [Anaerolineae bacterium]
MQPVKTTTRLYCNVLALQKGLDPVGYAHHFEDALAVEIPLPWKNSIYHEAGVLPQEVIDLMALWMQRYQAGQGYPHRPLMIAPDEAYSRPGMCRVMFYQQPQGAFAHYSKREYLVPRDQLGPLIWALYEANDDLPQFEIYREPEHDTTRDLMVCTHGTIDAACAKFGYPLYHSLRKHHSTEHLRTWRVSHFGGHVFAPTMMDMPTGHYWAYVEEPQAAQIAERTGDVRALYGHYRGWAGMEDGFLQAAERELWMAHGWAWFGYDKTGRVIAQDGDHDQPGWADVQIDYASADGVTSGTYTARVEARRPISTPHSTHSDDEYPYPQYKVI